MQRETYKKLTKQRHKESQNNIVFSQLVSDLEIPDMVETEMNDPTISSALNMTRIEH